eukprot:TRINITY_DN23102_c0_g1_i1.p1 TRINITY_DN23102_c0_g1~~TRINITY_DN23102_c0_g1_i1.p1  ORF type:complete len:316 (+),score=11.76 TRINITY_DN23102_c0_g1_i1:198-1145(+)
MPSMVWDLSKGPKPMDYSGLPQSGRRHKPSRRRLGANTGERGGNYQPSPTLREALDASRRFRTSRCWRSLAERILAAALTAVEAPRLTFASPEVSGQYGKTSPRVPPKHGKHAAHLVAADVQSRAGPAQGREAQAPTGTSRSSIPVPCLRSQQGEPVVCGRPAAHLLPSKPTGPAPMSNYMRKRNEDVLRLPNSGQDEPTVGGRPAVALLPPAPTSPAALSSYVPKRNEEALRLLNGGQDEPAVGGTPAALRPREPANPPPVGNYVRVRNEEVSRRCKTGQDEAAAIRQPEPTSLAPTSSYAARIRELVRQVNNS